jgi:hypothetical protein
MNSNVISLAEARQRRSHNPHESLFAMLNADFPSDDCAQFHILFVRFGLDVSPDTPLERLADIWEWVTGRMGRHDTMLAYTPDIFDMVMRGYGPQYARYLSAVLRDDRETVCRLAAELRILESIRSVA